MPKLPVHFRLPRLYKPQLTHILRVIVLVGALTEGWILWQSASAKEAIRLATTRQPENYTEVYFSNVGNLPKLVEPRKTVTFRYDIVNHSTKAHTYTAYVSIIENGKPRLLQTDTPTIPAGNGTTLEVPFSTALRGAKLQLRVEVPAQNQVIHFGSAS